MYINTDLFEHKHINITERYITHNKETENKHKRRKDLEHKKTTYPTLIHRVLSRLKSRW